MTEATQSDSAFIQLDDVGKVYYRGRETIEVLKQLHLTMPEGAFEALMGPSGSGKSTLLNLIAGLDSPSSGSVRISGQDLGRMSESQRAHWRSQNVGFIFQTYNLLPVLTAAENVELPLLLTKLSSRERKERARVALRVVGLEDRADHRPDQLSGGQQQRVAIARALVKKPLIVIADEPTANLDSANGEQVIATMERLNRELGTTFLLSSHDSRVIAHAKRVVTLRDGKLVSDELLTPARQATAEHVP